MYLALLNDFKTMDKKLRLVQFELPIYVLKNNTISDDYWKNIPYAVTHTFSNLYTCQENSSRLINLLINELKGKFQTTQNHFYGLERRVNRRIEEI